MPLISRLRHYYESFKQLYSLIQVIQNNLDLEDDRAGNGILVK